MRETAGRKWQGRRCYATNMSQAEKAIRAVAYEAAMRLRFPRDGAEYRVVMVAQVSDLDIRRATSEWYVHGLSPATINKRLNCLSAMGVCVEGCRAREPKMLKWWLKPEDEERLRRFLLAKKTEGGVLHSRYGDIWRFIQWTTRTGLRVEETLRLRRSDFSEDGGKWSVTVPGLKTAGAQATLPLSDEAAELVAQRFPPGAAPDAPFIFAGYDALNGLWQECREFLKVQDNPTATLKALRRSAARHLHVTKGMPLDMVRQYLRHEDIETTMGYLRLTGGYGTEEMRKWL
ncbi:tyrosine-type recombinase/integrase [Methylobacterium ajmalii]|uniref:tyrosine-type recombinase/integrase n=1 Tax=Methylobacterium ajmalii TaxID=2738439 RepID=UPI00190DBEC4|nr:site-specific integrase [Methylobacterium ajmalii]MBK3400406.1 site-specific integrase [Methylobacterium ajmalii]MBK3407552.1 site-specific integrase [Methylobacterium ajmalii]MBK3422100.1 site-specific integrase [Methylobacterium ajmalii]MBZ6415630.1 site-specific integrase [Methylobacterium sp.]